MIKVVFVLIVLSLSVIFAYLAMSNKKDEEIHFNPTPRVLSFRAFRTFRPVTPRFGQSPHVSARFGNTSSSHPCASPRFRVFPHSRTDSYDITRYAFVRGFGWFRHGEDIFNKIFKGYKFSKKTFFIFETFFRKKK